MMKKIMKMNKIKLLEYIDLDTQSEPEYIDSEECVSEDVETYSADFETTTDVNDCRVWAWGLENINTNEFEYGNTIETFFERIKNKRIDIYFHNLKFDGEFIIHYLLKNGFKFVSESKDLKENCFTTLITDLGIFYCIEICYAVYKKSRMSVKIYDSLKLFPFSVDKVAKSFDMPINKLEIDYKEYREVGHELTEEEISYLKNDVEIVAVALKRFKEKGLNRMTLGSNALSSFKDIISTDRFKEYFPLLNCDKEIRLSYKGGFTYANPKFKDKIIGEGIVLDVNSLYPSVMYYEKLPIGVPIMGEGKYEKDGVYNLYVQCFSCSFKLKENKIPTVQLKNSLAFCPTDYIEDSDDEYPTLVMTNVDFELFLEQYYVYDIEYHWYYKFQSSDSLFKPYIDKWMNEKIEAEKHNNMGMRLIAKLMLNNLYGKFATNPKVANKEPYLLDDVVKYKIVKKEDREPLYVAVGSFITSYARNKTIRSAQSVYDRFLYADTDSLHLIGTEIPDNLEVDKYKLGAWKHESTFTKAKYIRAKSYIEEIDGKLNVVCAGMPKQCHSQVTFDNFVVGATFDGKLRYKHCAGGIVLVDTPFTIKE